MSGKHLKPSEQSKVGFPNPLSRNDNPVTPLPRHVDQICVEQLPDMMRSGGRRDRRPSAAPQHVNPLLANTLRSMSYRVLSEIARGIRLNCWAVRRGRERAPFFIAKRRFLQQS